MWPLRLRSQLIATETNISPLCDNLPGLKHSCLFSANKVKFCPIKNVTPSDGLCKFHSLKPAHENRPTVTKPSYFAFSSSVRCSAWMLNQNKSDQFLWQRSSTTADWLVHLATSNISLFLLSLRQINTNSVQINKSQENRTKILKSRVLCGKVSEREFVRVCSHSALNSA